MICLANEENQSSSDSKLSSSANDAAQAAVALGKIATKTASGNYLGAAKDAAKSAGPIVRTVRIVAIILCIILLFPLIFPFIIPQMVIDDKKPMMSVSRKETHKVAKEYVKNWEKFAFGYEEYIYGKIEFVLDTHLLNEPYAITEYGNEIIEHPNIAKEVRKMAASAGGSASKIIGDYTYSCQISGGGNTAVATVIEHYFDRKQAQENKEAIKNGADPDKLPPSDYDTDGCFVRLDGDSIYTPFNMIELASAWTLKITETQEEAIRYKWKQKDYKSFYEWLDYWSYYLLNEAAKEKPNEPNIKGSTASFPWWPTADIIELMELPEEKIRYLDAVYLCTYGTLDGILSGYHIMCEQYGERDELTKELDEPFRFCCNAQGYSSYFNVEYLVFERDIFFDPDNDLHQDSEGIFNPETDFNFEAFPADISYISSSYGMRTFNGKRRMHYGLDIVSTEIHGPIYSVTDGVVASVLPNHSERGSTVVIKHENRKNSKGERPFSQYNSDVFYTTYQHLSHIGVFVGQKVKVGGVIGKQGGGGGGCADEACRKGSGSTSGHHLHFAVSRNNPLISGDKKAGYYSPIINTNL